MTIMRYRRDKVPGATKAERPFKPGGELYWYKVFETDELEDGWFAHPDEIQAKKKPGPKPKVKADDHRD